jgi:hypothetical protein
MAVEARFTEQFPVVGTKAQREAIEAEAQRTRKSMAAVVRQAIDERYGLSDGEVPQGDSPQREG